MSEAVQGFLQSPDPDPSAQHRRFGTVARALRYMLDAEERTLFPLCLRHAQASASAIAAGRPGRLTQGVLP